MRKQLTIYRRYVRERTDHTSYNFWAVYFLDKARAESFHWCEVQEMCELTVAEAQAEMTVKDYTKLLLTGFAQVFRGWQ